MNDDASKELIQEIRAIKTLLLLQSLATGYKQKQLAAALGVSPATLNRMIPKGLHRDAATNASRTET